MKQPILGVVLAVSIGLSTSFSSGMALAQAFDSSEGGFAGQTGLPASDGFSSRVYENLQMLATASPKPTATKSATAKTTQPGLLQMGITNFNKGYIAKAIPYFEKATQQDPNNEMSWLWLAKAHQKQGSPADFEKAKEAFQKVLAINPNNLEALPALGEMWSWDPGKRTDAIGLLKHAYDLNPADATTARKLSEALFWQGDVNEALRYAGPIANRYRTDHKFMGEYAQMLSRSGHAEQALEIYNTVLKEESQHNIALKLDQATALLQSGQKQQARALYAEINQAVVGTQLAKNSDLGLAMAGLAFDLGLYADGLKWDQSLPDSLQRQKDVQLRAARALVRTARMPEAIERFNRLYESGLLSAEEKLEFADYLRQLNLEPSALPSPNLIENLYKEAAQEKPDNAEALLRQARLLGEEGNRFDETVKAYQQALASNSLSDRDTVKKEYLDFLKSDKTQQAAVEALFQQMLTATPDDIQVKSAYAEFISWQKDRRAEALRLYVDLAKNDAENRELWESRIEEVLKWHQPTTALIPLYQEIVNVFPEDKAIWLAVARAYRSDKHYYKEAVETYSIMVQRYPDDGSIKREWLGLLTSNDSQRGENIALLKKMTEQNPSDMDVQATYGKLLSYEHKYGQAMDIFNRVLQQNPEQREALVGKGYVILWSGNKLKAKEFFSSLRQQYPDDVDIAIGLAQAEKQIGRYDEAMRILQEIRPLMQKNPEAGNSASYIMPTDYLPVANWTDETLADANPLNRGVTYDFSILPYDGGNTVPAPAPVEAPAPSKAAPSYANSQADYKPYSAAPETNQAYSYVGQPTANEVAAPTSTAATPELRSLQSEVDALSDAVNALKSLQESSRRQLDKLGQTVKTSRDVASGELHLQSDDNVASTAGFSGAGTGSAHPGGSVGESGMTPVYGTYSALDYDTNPLLSGMGRFKNDELSDVERALTNELRPMLRAGFLYSTQDGQATTTGLNSWGFPNQISMSLTPQIRVRGGLRPTKYYLPDGVNPKSTWGMEYGFGTTIKYWDRLTLDGDMAITHFTQSGTENLTFQTQATYAVNDSIQVKLGARRVPQYNSLLAIAGLSPSQGAFRNELVGQARENTIYGELNLNPFSHNIDWNLGYEWGFVDGEHIPRNFKNQAFTSVGYTWHYAANHQLRLGYEFLYFGYGKNATNGYFDTTAAGVTDPVVSLRPVTLANSGYVFGGYYSPKMFIMNAGRLDFRGSLFNKFLEYKLGGSLGAQTVSLGHHINEKAGTKLSTAFDANIILNLTDWLAAYGDVDYLNAGLQFNRWRFGGGLIVRPHITALSPVFGQPIDKRR